MKIAIVGCGVVGGALVRWLRTNTDHDLACIDPGLGLRDDPSLSQAAFFCVPVPTDANQSLDTSTLYASARALREILPDVPFFVRSTVLPGVCEALAEAIGGPIIPMPEFLTERRADGDFEAHPLLLGTERRELLSLIADCFPNKEIMPMGPVEACLAKYVHNCFGALKIGYFNNVRELCDRLQARYSNVLNGVMITGYIGREHTRVPGPDGSWGFGGKCLPKDLSAFVRYLGERGLLGGLTLACTAAENFYYRKK